MYGLGIGCSIAEAGSHRQSVGVLRFSLKDYSHRVAGIGGMSLMIIADSDSTILSLLSFSGVGTETPQFEGLPTVPWSIFGGLLSIVSSRSRPEAAIEAPTACLKATGGGHA